MRVIDYEHLEGSKFPVSSIGNITEILLTEERITTWLEYYPDALAEMRKARRSNDVHYSHLVEGMPVDIDYVKSLTPGSESPSPIEKLKIHSLYTSDSFLDSLVSKERLSLEDVLSIHRLLMSGYSHKGGKLRSNNTPHLGYGTATEISHPATLSNLEYTLDHFFTNYNRYAGEGVLNRMLTALYASLDFLSISPFQNGNGRMHRLMTHLLLRRCGILCVVYCSLNEYIYKNRSDFLRALKLSTSGWAGSYNNYGPYVENMLGMMAECCRYLNSCFPPPSWGKVSKSERIRFVVSNLEGRFTRADVESRVPDVSVVAIQKELTDMIRTGILEKRGNTRNTNYQYLGPQGVAVKKF